MPNTGGYEAHLTYPLCVSEVVERIGTERGWVFSQISGCPLLGQGTYCYLTNYAKDGVALLGDMSLVAGALAKEGVTPLRQKIERIVYDSKTGVDELLSVAGQSQR